MKIPTYNKSTADLPFDTLPAGDLVALPALIDCHVHFRVPGMEHKEDWATGARAALAGGVTTVCDMPNNTPATTTMELLNKKISLVDGQLAAAGLPLRRHFYIGATPDNEMEIRAAHGAGLIIGIKLFMGSSTGTLLVDKPADQARLFALAAELQLPLVLHAEDEATIEANKTKFPRPALADHSRIRSPLAAARALASALAMADEHKTVIYVLHASTAGEMDLIRQAKKSGIRAWAEATPHHLFLTTDDYQRLGTRAQMNPPLRDRTDQAALWEAVYDGTIDTIATDHAPHTLAEKDQPYPLSPSGVPGIETMLPLLLNAAHEGNITLQKIVELTRLNPQKIFNLPSNNDWAIVDLALTREVRNEHLKTKCAWSPYADSKLTGWPVATLLDGKIYLNETR